MKEPKRAHRSKLRLGNMIRNMCQAPSAVSKPQSIFCQGRHNWVANAVSLGSMVTNPGPISLPFLMMASASVMLASRFNRAQLQIGPFLGPAVL